MQLIRNQLGMRKLSQELKENLPFSIEGAFTTFEIKRLQELLKLMEGNPEHQALTSGDANYGGIRTESSERVAYETMIPPTPEFNWYYEKLEDLVYKVNESVYKFNLTMIAEPSIYLRYDGDEQGKYDPHIDIGPTYPTSLRKLSSTIILNDDYEGGDLIFNGVGMESEDDKQNSMYPKTPGTIIFFPSYLVHGVTPVTKGTRYAIVTWIHGPSFV